MSQTPDRSLETSMRRLRILSFISHILLALSVAGMLGTMVIVLMQKSG